MDSDNETKTEEHIKAALDLIIKGVDKDLIEKILLERGVSPTRLNVVIRWATVKAKDLGWI